MITPEDLPAVSESLARRIIAHGRSIAPCIDTLTGEDRLNAIAILEGVIEGAVDRGSLHILSERAGTVGVSYSTVRSWFQPDDKTSLRSLCGAVSGHEGPVGSFPGTATAISRVWPDAEPE